MGVTLTMTVNASVPSEDSWHLVASTQHHVSPPRRNCLASPVTDLSNSGIRLGSYSAGEILLVSLLRKKLGTDYLMKPGTFYTVNCAKCIYS